MKRVVVSILGMIIVFIGAMPGYAQGRSQPAKLAIILVPHLVAE
jgi:hypothetical protein